MNAPALQRLATLYEREQAALTQSLLHRAFIGEL